MDKKHAAAVGVVFVWFAVFLFSVDENSSTLSARWLTFFVLNGVCYSAFRTLLEDFVAEHAVSIGFFLVLCGLGAVLFRSNSDAVFSGGFGVGLWIERIGKKIFNT